MNEKRVKTHETHSSQDVLTFYDKYATTWDARFGHVRSTIEFHRIRLKSFLELANLKKTDCIVELGVGTGTYLDTIASLVREVICIDGSRQMLDIVQAKHGHRANIKIFQMDLELSSTTQSFQADLVYWFGLLEHIINIDAFMMNCRNMLQKEGRIVVVTPNAACPWYHGMRIFWRGGKHCSTDRYYGKKQLDILMSSHGFIPERSIYWGYFPAGVGNKAYVLFNIVGKIISRTSFRRYAGGLTASYRMK